MFQQWEKGREKTTFPIVFNYDYNRQKFANLDKADKKILLLPPSTPPPPPPPPPPPERRIPPKESSTTISSHDRKLRKRKSRSLERRRQPKTIELSDSDEDITAHPTQQSPPKIENIDEVDNCATVIKQKPTDVVVIVENVPIEQIEPLTEDNGAPSGSSGSGSAATVIGNPLIDRNQLRIDELSASTTSGNEGHSQQHVIVDVHEPVVLLEIREDSDDGPLRSSSFQTKLTKDKDLADVPEHEAEADNSNVRQSQQTELPVTTSVTPLPTTITTTDSMPLVLVQKCDINENVVETDLNTNNNHNSNDNHSSVIEVDINHNDVSHHINTKPKAVQLIDCNVVKNDSISSEKFDHRRMSESSRSSFDESDGMDTEPTYAKVESLLNRVSVVNYRN